MSDSNVNAFTEGPLGRIFLKTTLPIVLVMSMNGLLTVADAFFLGVYVGPDALASVTLMFPAYMLIVALSTLVSSGMSSLLARALGAQELDRAQAIFSGAHGLALLLGACLIALYLLLGEKAVLLAAGGSVMLAEMGDVYLRIMVFSSPLVFVLSVNSDALRNEGRVGFMAAMSLMVSLANILFNYVLIAQLSWGVAGSAFGTVFAQLLALVLIVGFRVKGQTQLRFNTLARYRLTSAWRSIFALGAPQSLSFVGLALSSATIVLAVQMVGSGNYENTISAYGIITRVITFVYLPLLGLSFAMQSIAGNNFGAKLWLRSNKSFMIAFKVALIYGLFSQWVLGSFAEPIAGYFVDDLLVISEVARIMPVMVLAFFVAGPLIMISSYFQAIGDVKRAAVLALSKPFIFAIPLTLILPFGVGEWGIWIAGPLAEMLLLLLTVWVLLFAARHSQLKWGLFMSEQEQSS